MKRAPHPEAVTATSHADPTLRILVIEDDLDLREPLCEILRSWGYDVSSAATGAAGLLLLTRTGPEVALPEVALPAVALIDIGLPDMSGYEVASRICDRGAARPYLIALTGLTGVDDGAHAMQAGFDLHLSKPPDLVALREVLATIAHGG